MFYFVKNKPGTVAVATDLIMFANKLTFKQTNNNMTKHKSTVSAEIKQPEILLGKGSTL